MYEVNPNIVLMESINAKINRLQQTIKELKHINKRLVNLNNSTNTIKNAEIKELTTMLDKQTKLAVKQKQIIKHLKTIEQEQQ